MKKYLFGVVVLFLSVCVVDVYAQVQLSVSKTYGKKIKVAIVKAGAKNVSASVSGVVADDMKFSGSFSVPDDLVVFKGEKTPQALALKGAEVVVSLDCDVDGVRCAVFSGGASLSMVMSNFYPLSDGGQRVVSHKIADDIIYALTGEKGFTLSNIVFVSDKGGSKNVYMADYDGAGMQRLTLNKSTNVFPDMAKDKSFLLYTSYFEGHPYLYRQDKNGKVEAISKFPGLNTLPAVSVNRDVALVLSRDGNPEVYTMNRFGASLERITRSKGIDTSPTWSPDGEKLAFVSNRKGNPQIYIKEIGQRGVTRLTYSGKYNSSPSWSPKGNLIAYDSMTNNKFEIFVIDIESGEVFQITDDNASNESPSWGPNGATLVYSSTEKGAVNLKIVDIYEKKPRQITFSEKDGNCMNPKWVYKK